MFTIFVLTTQTNLKTNCGHYTRQKTDRRVSPPPSRAQARRAVSGPDRPRPSGCEPKPVAGGALRAARTQPFQARGRRRPSGCLHTASHAGLVRGSHLESRSERLGGRAKKRPLVRKESVGSEEGSHVLLAVPHRQNLSAARKKGKATGADKLYSTKNMPTRK